MITTLLDVLELLSLEEFYAILVIMGFIYFQKCIFSKHFEMILTHIKQRAVALSAYLKWEYSHFMINVRVRSSLKIFMACLRLINFMISQT